ncbi:UNVERIFIED_CONTAM: hypothetical protein K2H54_000189 [Gekko kuhli]
MQTHKLAGFEMVELRVGTLVRVEPFPRGTPPGLQGAGRPPDIVAVVNFPPKQIGPIQSEFLLTGFYRPDGAVVIAIPEQAVEKTSAKLAEATTGRIQERRP